MVVDSLPQSHIIPANYTPIDLDKDEIMIRFYDSPDWTSIFEYKDLKWLEEDMPSKYWIVAPP